MAKNLHLKSFYMIVLAILLLINFNSCRSESTDSEEINSSSFKNSIQRKTLKELPEIVPVLNEINAKVKGNHLLNKGVEDFEIDEENILVLDLQEQGQLISMVVNDPVLDASYSVTNLNIVRNNGIESYFLTKYIPTN